MDAEGRRTPVQDRRKTKAQLLDELVALRRQLAQHSSAEPEARPPDPILSREENESLQLLMENVQEYAIILLDPNGRVTQWNSGAEQLLGYSEAEMLGQPGARIFTPEDIERGAPEQELQQARATGRAADERWHQRKDGTRFWGSGMLTALRHEQGQIRGFAKILRDLTERHNAAVEREGLLEQMAFERRRLETVLQQMPAGVVIAEAPSGALVLGNPAMERIFGHPFVLVDGVDKYTCYRGLHTDGQPYLPDEWPMARALTKGEEVRDEEILIPRPDGTQATALVSATPIRDRYGHIVAAVTVANDITARKEAEEERGRLLTELQRVNAELQQFASIVSHDLSEPLRAITSFTTLLAQQYHGQLDAKADEYLAFVTNAAQRMQQMLADLLAYRQLGVGVHDIVHLKGPRHRALSNWTKGPRHRALIR
jgi:PAS domain S-box-containing protein